VRYVQLLGAIASTSPELRATLIAEGEERLQGESTSTKSLGLGALAVSADEPERARLLDEAVAAALDGPQLDALAALARQNIALPADPVYVSLHEAMRAASGSRSAILSQIAVLAPLLRVVGGPNVLLETARAIEEVATCWP
jgi:hypothetical protein